MERITYRKTLDVHKNGVQFMLQGFETADKLSRVIEISLMASGDAVDLPLERMVAMMYVTSPGASEPSINACRIEDNKIVYDVLPIVTEGITTMQLKLIETSADGVKRVLASPRFAVEVSNSGTDDDGEELKTTFTALEKAIADAKIAYDERFLRMELTSDCMFKAYYADGSYYETDVLKRLFLNGNVLLSESFAHGGTGLREGEDTDNSMYYSNVSKSEAIKAKDIMENSEDILSEVRLRGTYTAFTVDFETGEVIYVSPSFKFNVNLETGELDAEGQRFTFKDEVFGIVDDWLAEQGVVLMDLVETSETHSEEIEELKETTSQHAKDIKELSDRVIPIEKGGTGVTTVEEIQDILGIPIPIDLWTNENPNEEFESQKIEMDLSAFKRIIVVVKHSTAHDWHTSNEILMKDKEFILSSYDNHYSSVYEITVRTCNFSDTGINFGIGGEAGIKTSYNDLCIPIKVIGYKF